MTLGRTVNELLDTMDSDEYTHWIAYKILMDKQGQQDERTASKQHSEEMKANLLKFAGRKGVKHGDR